MPRPASDELVPPPIVGRVFTSARRARVSDLTPGGRLRFDAVARYLQDISNDDTTDGVLEDDMYWVVRRLVVELRAPARFRERLELSTWCSGIGGRWAERRVQVRGDRGAEIEAAALWVHVAPDTGKPQKLPDGFALLYGPAAGGRRVGVRLRHDPVVPATVDRRPWALRVVDFDLLGHMNNAAYWAIIEEELARRRDLRPPLRAEIEYRAPVERGGRVELAVHDGSDGALSVWLVSIEDDGAEPTLHATGRVLPITSGDR